jgi:hypothetical protein
MDIVRRPDQLYKCLSAEESKSIAARKIQYCWKAFKAHMNYLDYLEKKKAAKMILAAWRRLILRHNIMRQIRAKFETIHLKKFHRLLAAMLRDWAHIAARQRIMILLSPRFGIKDNPQLVLGR